MPRDEVTIVSGGQTGVDRAALDVALELGLSHGGWCPRGRRAEDGPIPLRYHLTETQSFQYAVRTRWNVRDSDATLVMYRGVLMGGTRLTAEIARRLGKPSFLVDLDRPPAPETVRAWMDHHAVRILNVAGPRASQAANVYADAHAYLVAVFTPSIERT